MRLLRQLLPLFFLISGLAMLCPRAALAQPVPDDLLCLLPDDTRFVFYVRDVPGLLAKWRASPMGRAYEASRSGSFLGPLRDRLKALRGLLVDEDGMDPQRLDAFFCGRWVMAGLPAPAGSPSPVVWVLIFDHNNDPAVLERFRSGSIRAGGSVQRTEQEADGFHYQRLRVSEEVAAEIPIVAGATGADGNLARTADVRQSAIRMADQYFGDRLAILALVDGDPIRRVLPRLAHPGDGPSLADSADRRHMAAGLPTGSDIECYAATAALADWFVAHPRPELAWLNLAALRLGEMRAARATLNFTDTRLDADVSLFAPQPCLGLWRLFFPAESLKVAEGVAAPQATRLVPADALVYSAGHYPLGEFWTLGRDLLRGAMPPLGMTLDGPVNAVEQATGLDMRKDLLDLLGPEAVRFSRASGPAGRQRVNTTFLIRLRQPRKVRISLVTLLGALSQRFGAFYIEEDRVGDWPVISFYLGNPASAGGIDRKAEAILCLADGWLVAGRQPGDIAEVLKRIKGSTGDSIADVPDFKAVMDRLPAGRLSEGYVNLAALRALIGRASQSSGSDMLKNQSIQVAKDWLPLDLRALPKAVLAGESLGTAGYSSRIVDDQLHISAFILYP